MLELFNRGLSRTDGGGTLKTYAANISHLLRFCWKRRIDPIDLTDDNFVQFVKKLGIERRARKPEALARDSNHVLAIGRNCLDFLASLGRRAGDAGFVGPEGRIKCEQREYPVKIFSKSGGASVIYKKYWYHWAFPAPDPKKHRLPISSDLIDRLRAAIEPASKSTHLRKRRYTTIKLLEITGGRRIEVASLTVASVRKAAGMEEPMLEIKTFKKRGGTPKTRVIPIHPHDVKSLMDYIDVNRARIIRRTCGAANDHGFLLVNGKTGRALRAGTITKEIRLLATEAGIEVQACPHMFRHRYITKLFVALIEAHKCQNEDEFRRALLDGHTLREKIREWTGHDSLESLNDYIHLAFDEITGFRKTYGLVSTKLAVESFCATVDQTIYELENAHLNGEPQGPIFDGFVGVLKAFKVALARTEMATENTAT